MDENRNSIGGEGASPNPTDDAKRLSSLPLKFSTHTENFFKRYEITTIGQLRRLIASGRVDLSGTTKSVPVALVPKVGTKTIEEIAEEVQRFEREDPVFYDEGSELTCPPWIVPRSVVRNGVIR